MKNLVKKFRDGLIIGAGILTMLGIGTFAYSTISNVSPNETLTATKFNEMINRINELEITQGKIAQDAYDTNEYNTGRVDKRTGKAIYSKWINFGAGPTGSDYYGRKSIGIPNIYDIVWYEATTTTGNYHQSWTNFRPYVNKNEIAIYTNGNWSNYNFWFYIEYTKTTD